MFTGIVAGVGRVVSRRGNGAGLRLVVRPRRGERPFTRGESVAISGVCLTALRGGALFSADLSAETLSRTNLGALEPGDAVNVERALRWGDRLSGHFVLGHVDAVAELRAIAPRRGSWTYRFTIPVGLSRFVAEKGSVAVDGVSLTVARRGPRDFDVAIIPETRRRTTLGGSRPGDRVNFEVDVFARYGRRGALARVRRQRASRS
jgi:riboflavin synthase